MSYPRKFLYLASTQLYGYFLHLYPSRFRAEFTPEMSEVFMNVMDEAESNSTLLLSRIALRELAALMTSIFHERLIEMRQSTPINEKQNDWRWHMSRIAGNMWKPVVVWMIANILGIGFVAIMPALFPGVTSLHNNFVSVLVITGPISLAQWLALRSFTKVSILWVLSIPVGFLLYLFFLRLVPEGLRYLVDGESIFTLISLYLIMGLLVGLIQWLILRQIFIHSSIWLLGSSISLAVASGLVLSSGLIEESGSIALILSILIYVLTTGLILSWLLAQQARSSAEVISPS